MTLLTTIISSTVIATILSSLVNYWMKKQDFKNEYYKMLLAKRMDAYQEVENQISILKTSVLDKQDGKAYHQVFSFGDDYFLRFGQSLSVANSKNIWLNDQTNNKLAELMHIINKIPFEYSTSDEEQLIAAGKKYYWEIANLRDELENMTRSDLLNLHKFSEIRRKSNELGLQIIDTRNS